MNMTVPNPGAAPSGAGACVDPGAVGRVLDAAPDAMVAIDAAGIIVLANAQMEPLFGHAPATLIGQSLNVLIPARFHALHAGHVARYARLPTVRPMGQGFELVALHRDGREFPVEISISPLPTTVGILTLGAIRDLSERKRQEEALVEAREQAQAATRAKSEFLARISHDLRSPMQGILGAIDLLRSTALSAEQAEHVRLVETGAESVLAMTHDLLDLARIHSGQLNLHAVPFELAAHVRQVAALMALDARARALAFTVDLAPDLPTRVIGDPHRLTRILANLLGNAIKFTREGGVGLRLRRSEGDEGAGHLWFTIEDSGIGIASDEVGRIFEAYEQGAGVALTGGGAGLGLAITRELVRLMGGRIWVDSTPGRGSTFHVTIPLDPAPPGDAASPGVTNPAPLAVRTAVGRPLRVLVAEDAEESRAVLGEYLTCCACEAHYVASGAEAVAYLEQASVDVVLMDLNLPGLSGEAAIRVIRTAEAARGAPPVTILALTADARPEARARSLDAGANIHLLKPLRLADLAEALGSLLSEAPALAQGERVAAYLVRRADELAQLRRCLSEGDFDTIRLLAHRLSGHAGAYGFADLGALGCALEQAAALEDGVETAVLIARVSALLATYALNR